LNPVDYKIWGVKQQRVYETHFNYSNNLDEHKQRLIEVWSGGQQNILDASIGECRKLVFTHLVDISNIHCRTIENDIGKLKKIHLSPDYKCVY